MSIKEGITYLSNFKNNRSIFYLNVIAFKKWMFIKSAEGFLHFQITFPSIK